MTPSMGPSDNRHRLLLAEQALKLNPRSADAHYNRGNALQALSRHAEALASYDRALALDPDDAAVLNNRAVALRKLGRHAEALESLERALAVRPGYAEAFNNRGNALLTLQRCEEALASFDQALAIRPDFAEAHNNRGNALQALNRNEEALASYDRALAINPDYADALDNRCVVLLNVGNAFQDLGRHEEALASYDRALAMTPESVDALVNRGNALQALKRHEDALASYERALAIRPDDAEAHWNEALARLAIGDYERGWEKYESRWLNPGLKSPKRETDKPLWLGAESLAGKTILLHAEQGFGDAIQAIRYAPLVAARGAKVIVACHELLRTLFETVPGVHSVTSPERPLPAFDCHVPLMSLPLAFRTTLETIPPQVPYLSAAQSRIERWRRRLAPHGAGPKVGLAWAGNPQFTGAGAKYCPVDKLLPLVRAASCSFVSLQKGAATPQLAMLAAGGRVVVDAARELESFEDTAALICALDLVISVDTAVAHLAGALGRPVWILLPFAADWRWLVDREDSPWYPSARLFRQSRPGDWESVVQRVARELAGGNVYDGRFRSRSGR